MSLTTNFSGNPYYDDYTDNKKFLRLLYKPGYAVQARELTQTQSSLQSQIGKFANHIFKNGSVVEGGEFFLQNSTYLKLNPSYQSVDLDINNFVGKTIFSNDLSKRAQIIKIYDKDLGTNEPITFMIKQIYGDDFIVNDVIKTSETTGDGPFFATVSDVGTGQTFSINAGVFYYDDFFISNDAQTIATSKYSANTATAKIGFEIVESIVTSDSDATLLDPAQDASNFQAPGADRYKIDLVLSTRSLDSVDMEKFIELMQIKNGQIITQSKYPIYSVIADTLARRTYDESGNYTTKAFRISVEDNAANTAQTNIILSPGKAYVFGYEHETISPTTLVVDKPRTTASVENKRIPVEHGNYVYTTNHVGAFPIKNLYTVDIHCINTASLAVDSGSRANTKIGTTRIKTLFFDSASNTSDANTYTYQTFVFDTSVSSITGVVDSSSTSDYIKLTGQFSTVNNAYTGAKLRITSGPGSNEFAKTITYYDGVTKTANISPRFITTPNTSSIFSIDFEFKDAESFAYYGVSSNAYSNFADKTKDASKTYNDAILFESNYEPILNELGEAYISFGSIADMSYSYKRLYTSVSFNVSESTNLSIGLPSGERISAASSDSTKQQNYYITVTTQGTSPYPVGSIIPSNKFTVDEDTNTITVVDGNNMVADIIATIDVTNAVTKEKNYITANSAIQTSGGYDVFNNTAIVSYPSKGQCQISASSVIKIPGNKQSLYVTDVVSIEDILDFNEYTITTANLEFATSVVNSYTLDNGQKDSYYDHSAIVLKPGATIPRGALLVKYNKFLCDQDTPGFFTVDSYSNIDYEEIPTYISTKTGLNYNLKDCLDFRPVRKDTTTGLENAVSFIIGDVGPKIPEYSSDIVLDYAYYLPRVDKVILDKSRVFSVLTGNPSINPVIPKDSSTGMTLFVLSYPPYLPNSSDVSIRSIDHRRYTMRDIGSIDKRLQNIEYYTSLTLLEHETLTKQDLTTLDTQNLPRFKNGIIVDSFKGQSIADVSNYDYIAAIDPINKELRPIFNISAHRLNFDSANSANYLQTGPLISLNYEPEVFIDQNKSTKITNVNPFNIINYLGKVKLIPDSDIWVETDLQPQLLVNMEGDRDAWAAIAENSISYEWNAWNTIWTGVDTDTQSSTSTTRIGAVATISNGDIQSTLGQGTGTATTTTTSTTTTTTSSQTRTGIMTTIIPSTMTESLGTRVIDVSIIPYMRNINILFIGTDFKPNRELYPYFENQPVKNYISNRVNKFVVANNNLQFAINPSNPTVVNIINTTNSTTVGSGLVVHTSNNIVYVTNIVSSNNFNAVGSNYQLSGFSNTLNGNVSYNIVSYQHRGGTFLSVANTSVMTLRTDGRGFSSSDFVGNTIFITSGTGAGQSANITSYNTTTGQIVVSPAFTTAPTSSSSYGIGDLRTDLSGTVVGIFSVPGGTYLIGQKLLRFMDNIYGDLTSSSTSGDAQFYAQGLLQKTQETIISTTVPTIQRVLVNDSRIITDTDVNSSSSTVTTWVEPIAETFLVSSTQYPSGVFLTSLRFCFKTKDESVPITLQLRTTVNGYPSSSVVYPFSTVSVNPDKVNVTDSPDLNDPTKYTEFTFDSPVYLQPGEHCFVLITNSNQYEAYLAEIGKLDLVTGDQISEQPYGGTFFASQTSTTWTADQSSDLMFRIYRADFDINNPAALQFLVDAPETPTKYSLFQLLTSELLLSQTAINHIYGAELEAGGFTDYLPLVPGRDYELDDSLGMRILNPETGDTTFILGSFLSSTSSAVSPIIDSSRIGIITVENIINNLELANTGFIIESNGSAYINTATVNVTISGGGGSGATASANVIGGIIDAIYLTDPGYGYHSSPTITVEGVGAGSGAIIKYNGETEKFGGNANARYLSRRVTLADGFDSGDLRVYLTAYKPTGTNIYVYYKLLSSSDNESFEYKKWQLMTQLGNANYVSLNKQDYRELVFAPGTNGEQENSITYTDDYGSAFNTFITFAIKIVMSSAMPTIVPKIRDFRAIALPAG